MLAALKFFRNLVGLQDDFYNQQMVQQRLFEPVLNIVYETMPRDNLLNSACLEFFEHILRRENVKGLVSHIVENYRDKIQDIRYVDTFAQLISRYDQSRNFPNEQSILDTEEDTPGRSQKGDGRRWQGMKDLDAAEEEYFNTSDDEDEATTKHAFKESINGASPLQKPLVDYNSDEEEAAEAELVPVKTEDSDILHTQDTDIALTVRPERLSEKRRREEDEEDELTKMAHIQNKRRNSTSSVGSVGSNSSNVLRRKRGFSNGKEAATTKKMTITLAPAIKSGGEGSSTADVET